MVYGIAMSAQAQDSLALSGEINLALVHLAGDGAAAGDSALNRLDSTNSRWVIRGKESVATGWQATFLMSNGFRADTGSGATCSRECTIGLSGPYGSLKLGRQLDVYDDVSLPWYYQEAAGNHNPSALWANCGAGAGTPEGCLDDYLDSSIRYDTVSLSGLSASILVAKPVAERPSARVGAAGIELRQQPFYAGVAFKRQWSARGDGLADFAVTASVSVQGGGYYLAAAVERLLYETPEGSVRRHYWGLLVKKAGFGLDVDGTLWLNVGQAGSGYGGAPRGMVVNQIKLADDSGALMWTLGYSHRLSARTVVYGYVNAINNQRNAGYAFDSQLASMGPFERLTALAFGMSKKF